MRSKESLEGYKNTISFTNFTKQYSFHVGGLVKRKWFVTFMKRWTVVFIFLVLSLGPALVLFIFHQRRAQVKRSKRTARLSMMENIVFLSRHSL